MYKKENFPGNSTCDFEAFIGTCPVQQSNNIRIQN